MASKTINAPFVDFNGHRYKPGEEDQLAAVLPKRDVDVYVERGILEGDWSGAGELPSIKNLPDHLAGIESADDVRALKARDERKSAAVIYDARIAELEAE